MPTPEEHSAFMLVPTAAFEDLVKKVDQLLEQRAVMPDFDFSKLGIEPLRTYDAKEAAHILGIKRVQSVYEIPDEDLPRVKRIGSNVGFLGINLLCYSHGLAPVDMTAAIEQFRARLMSDRPNVQPLRPTGKSRVV